MTPTKKKADEPKVETVETPIAELQPVPGVGLIFSKIPKIMGLVWVVWKDRENKNQHYKFRGIDDMYNALNKHLASEGIFFTSEVLDEVREERQSASGGNLIWSIITVKFTGYASDGSSISSTMKGEAMDSGDKGMNKAMSVAYKYMLMQLFCIPTDEDKDTEVETHVVKAKEPTAPAPVKKIVPTTLAPAAHTPPPEHDFQKPIDMPQELHQCNKCRHNVMVDIKQWPHWPYFKCPDCQKNSPAWLVTDPDAKPTNS